MKRLAKIAAVTAAAALLLSACSGSDDDQGSSDLNGEPIVIGAQATLNGASAFPEYGIGLEAAEHYINEVKGGIGGRPLELEVCDTDGTPEAGVNCANELVGKGVPVVIDSYDFSIGGSLPIYQEAKVPIFGTLTGSGQVDAAEYGTAFYTSGPTEVSAVGTATVVERGGYESTSMVITDVPAGHTYVDTLLKPIFESLGIDFNVVYVDGAGANFNVVAASQIDGDPEMAGIISLPEEACTQLIRAIRQQNYEGPIYAGSCTAFKDELAQDAEGVIIQPRLWVPDSRGSAPEEIVADLDAFEEAMDAIGEGDDLSTRSLYAFASVVNLVEIIEAAVIDAGEEPDTVNVTEALKAVEDFPSFAGPSITCDGQQWPGRPSACSREAIYFEVQSDGGLEALESSGYIELDPSIVPAAG